MADWIHPTGTAGGRGAPSTARSSHVHVGDDSQEDMVGMRAKRAKRAPPLVIHESDDDEEDDFDDYDDDDDEDVSSLNSRLNELTLKFFNEATAKELEELPRVSHKTATAIIKRRPYITWDHLFEQVSEISGVTSQLVWQAQDMVEEKQTTALLLNQCNKISKAIAQSFGDGKGGEVLSVSSEEDFVSDIFIKEQPKCLDHAGKLKSYQLVGLNWLALLHKHDVNAILADEMGLGKTIQAIAFIAHLHEQGSKGPHLIVVPPSTNDNWERELAKWAPHLAVLSYKGSQHERRLLRKAVLKKRVEYDIMLTTYSLCVSSSDDRAFLRKIKFDTVIFDEGHMLKNMKSQRYTYLMKVRGKRRILLTGTPLQNNLLELISLLGFIMPQIFSDNLDVIVRMFKKKVDEQESFSTSLINKARRIMMPFVLRRVKDQVLRQLPEKTTEVISCNMLPYQQAQYDALVAACKGSKTPPPAPADGDDDGVTPAASFSSSASTAPSSGVSRKGEKENSGEKQADETETSTAGVESSASTLNNYFMQLRKMANHPMLHRCRYTDDLLRTMSRLILKDPNYRECDPDIVFEDMEVMTDFELHNLCCKSPPLHPHKLDEERIMESGKFVVLQDLLPKLQEQGDRVLLFSQFTTMLDIMERFLGRLGIKFLRIDGSTPVEERQELIDKYSKDTSILCFLLSTKAGGLGINLTAANTVILHDIDFNPYNDKQAEDRCHRVGQTKPVKVIRLISKGTVEEVMLKRAELKLQLEKDMTESSLNSGAGVKDLMVSYLKEAQ